MKWFSDLMAFKYAVFYVVQHFTVDHNFNKKGEVKNEISSPFYTLKLKNVLSPQGKLTGLKC